MRNLAREAAEKIHEKDKSLCLPGSMPYVTQMRRYEEMVGKTTTLIEETTGLSEARRLIGCAVDTDLGDWRAIQWNEDAIEWLARWEDNSREVEAMKQKHTSGRPEHNTASIPRSKTRVSKIKNTPEQLQRARESANEAMKNMIIWEDKDRA